MSSRKERKQQIVAEVKAEKERRKARKAEIAALPAEQQAAARAKEKAARKEAKAKRKQEIRTLPKRERKAAKKHDKIYKKVWHRPRRAAIWAAVLCLLAYGIAMVAPIVGSIFSLMNLQLDSETPTGEQARAHAAEIAEAISDEGIVLLKNEDNALPLADLRVNVFGAASVNIRYGGGGSGGADQTRSINLYQGLSNAGIQANEQLQAYYETTYGSANNQQPGILQVVSSMTSGAVDEPAIDYLTGDMIAQAQQFSNNAIIVLGSDGVEASDFTPEELRLTANKRDLVKTVSENFENVIIIINAGNAMELGFLEEYPNIKAALWVGTPGPYGMNSLGDILAGKVNPSGRLVDTYAYDASSNPASVNFGDYKYTNIDGRGFLNYEESIYIGYRYYETYYQGDEAGYQKAVQFPFGHGLSYTTFEWETVNTTFDADQISVEVQVTNTGTAAGKDVVQLYFSAPYTAGGIEKSAIELGGYAKTKLLQPEESETVTITFATRDMSSYDMTKEQAYVLDAGTYQIHVARNVHDIVESQPYEVEETVVYRTDEATGTEIKNQFDYANGDLSYLSRNDWAGTYPDSSDMNYTASDELLELVAQKPAKVEGEAPTTGADNGIKLADLKGLDYDDPKWDQFLDQFTVKEMQSLVANGAYRTVPVERLGVPGSVLLDGPAGINSFFSAVTAASYPTEVIIASTWNDELAYQMGEAVGREANAYGVDGWYAPGMNIHRTPQGGRNFEYFSEDPLLSGKMAAGMVSGAQTHNIIVFMKHFALNEQEVNARSGVNVWANEQAIREIYLRPFEITVKEGKVTGAMSSFIHIGHKWSGGNPELLQNVLRDEWGFVGLVTTDAVLGKFMDVNLAIRSGNELMLAPLGNDMRYLKKLYRQDPVGVTIALRDCTHNICYALLNYTQVVQ